MLTTFLLIEKEITFHGSFDGLLSCPTVTLVDIPKEARIQKFRDTEQKSRKKERRVDRALEREMKK